MRLVGDGFLDWLGGWLGEELEVDWIGRDPEVEEDWRQRVRGFGGWDKLLGSRVRLIFISDEFRLGNITTLRS